MNARIIRLAAALGALALAVTAAPAANAAPQGFMQDTLFFGFFYDNVDDGVVVTAGVPIDDFCLQEAPAEAPLRVFLKSDGTATLKSHGNQDVAIYVYEFDGPGPALIGATCEAIFDADPTTMPPTPVATGTGLMKFTVTGIEGPDDIGGFHLSNSINGMATAGDGTQWKVIGRAAFETAEDGSPIGDPDDFQSLSVRQVRRGK